MGLDVLDRGGFIEPEEVSREKPVDFEQRMRDIIIYC